MAILLGAVLRGVSAAPPSLTQEGRYALCPPEPELPPAPLSEIGRYEPGTTLISADEIEAAEDGLSTLRGSAEIAREGQALGADLLTHQQDTAEAQGNVRYWGKDLFWSGQRGRWDLQRDIAWLEDGDYRLLKRRGHGKARSIQNESDFTRLEEVDYTTCDENNRVWALSAKDIKLRHAEEWGRAKHVFLEIRDIPILYLPYLSFPLTNKRKSGFLSPTAGVRSSTGFDLTLPYYWNIAPEQDATFAPRFMSERGIMLNGQYRYLLRSGRGQLDFGYLPNDQRLENDDRYLVAFTHQQSFPAHRINTYLTYNQVSDARFLGDLGTGLSQASTRFLERRADLSYSGSFWNLLTRVQDYQNIDPLAPPTYTRLPSVYFSASLPTGFRNLNFQLLSEATYFDHQTKVTGARIDLRPVLSYPIHTPGTFLIPRVSLRHTHYILDGAVSDNSPSRTIPIVSVDGGLILERDIELEGGSYVHTLEPRLFYLYIPRVGQDEIPLFDTGQYDISFYQLFREDRFSGPDRVGDANQLAVALSSRIISRETGLDRLRLSVGQILYFADREVMLPGGAVNRDPVSDVIGEISTRLTSAWSARLNMTWNPNDAQTRKATLGVRYWPAPDKIFNAEYRLRRDIVGLGQTDVEQTDVSARWPLTPNWAMLGRWLYSLETLDTVEAVGGIEYQGCCWGLRAVARRSLNSASGQFDNSFMVQLELKGLGGLGRGATTFLKRSIPGYQNEF